MTDFRACLGRFLIVENPNGLVIISVLEYAFISAKKGQKNEI